MSAFMSPFSFAKTFPPFVQESKSPYAAVNLSSQKSPKSCCGEGAGYAGGITSAAIDGIKVAEAIIKKYKPDFK